MRRVALDLDKTAVDLPSEKPAATRTLKTGSRMKLLHPRNKSFLGD
jgi:hypothetical protein